MPTFWLRLLSRLRHFESGRTFPKEFDGIWEEVKYRNGELHHVRLRRDLPPAGLGK
jgi:hypothetical protein